MNRYQNFRPAGIVMIMIPFLFLIAAPSFAQFGIPKPPKPPKVPNVGKAVNKAKKSVKKTVNKARSSTRNTANRVRKGANRQKNAATSRARNSINKAGRSSAAKRAKGLARNGIKDPLSTVNRGLRSGKKGVKQFGKNVNRHLLNKGASVNKAKGAMGHVPGQLNAAGRKARKEFFRGASATRNSANAAVRNARGMLNSRAGSKDRSGNPMRKKRQKRAGRGVATGGNPSQPPTGLCMAENGLQVDPTCSPSSSQKGSLTRKTSPSNRSNTISGLGASGVLSGMQDRHNEMSRGNKKGFNSGMRRNDQRK